MLTLSDLRQTTDYDCGAVAIDIVCQFYGRRARGPVKLANPVQGMAPDTVEAVFRSLGFKILAGTMTVDDLRAITRTRPILCCVNTQSGGHWVVVGGVARRRVYFQCPVSGPRSYTETQWRGVWHDSTTSGHHYDSYGLCAYLG